MKRIIAVLNEPRRIHEYVVYAQFVVERVAADPIFVSPRPPIAVLRADVAALRAATVAGLTGTAGAAAARRGRARKVHGDLTTLKCYVQEVADQHPREEAPSIIARAGMSVKNARGPSKPWFEAKQLSVSGEVHLFVRAAKGRASYDWQYATDPEHWLPGPRTVGADATLYGLVPGTVYYFRYRTVTSEGVSDWSQVISLLVV
jgi:hypothetical protein